MPSPIVIATAVESFLGALLTSGILYLVLSRGRQLYHYLFAAFLFICLFWDTGTFLLMIRNRHLEELPAIGYVISLPCTLLPSIVFHFACVYTKRLIKWAIVLGWVTTVAYRKFATQVNCTWEKQMPCLVRGSHRHYEPLYPKDVPTVIG